MTIQALHLRIHLPRAGWRLAVAVAAMAGGCSLGPEYRHPELALPGAWREHAAAAPANRPAAGWWRGFGSAELDAYVEQARAGNDDIAAAVARVRQADALATIAGAPLLPTLGANASALTERVQSANTQYANFRQYSPQLAASYMIDFWGKNRAALKAAEATASASRQNRATVELTVISGVVQAYFQNLELRDRIAVAEENQATAEAILTGLRRQLAAGVATALDVAQQETAVATLNAAIAPLRQQLAESQSALAILVGRMPESSPATDGTLGDLSLPAVAPGLPSELLARRPDVAQAEDQLIAANANIALARASFFPSIQLTASGGYASTALSALLNSSSRIYLVTAGIAQPIFDGGVLSGQYALAQARYDELLANYRKTVLSAFGDVENALAARRQTLEQVQRLTTAVEKARRAHEIAQAQLRSGTVGVLTVLNTESAQFAAQDALIQARFSQMQALVSLFAALGGGWQEASGS